MTYRTAQGLALHVVLAFGGVVLLAELGAPGWIVLPASLLALVTFPERGTIPPDVEERALLLVFELVLGGVILYLVLAS